MEDSTRTSRLTLRKNILRRNNGSTVICVADDRTIKFGILVVIEVGDDTFCTINTSPLDDSITFIDSQIKDLREISRNATKADGNLIAISLETEI